MHYDYLKWFLIFCWTPTIIIWLFYWRYLIRYKKVFLICILGSILFATPWDYWATHSWLWHFSPEHTLGINLLGLPVEEYVFFITETLLYASLALALRSHFKSRKI
jgi:lycopene cyclase domain-containing protein